MANETTTSRVVYLPESPSDEEKLNFFNRYWATLTTRYGSVEIPGTGTQLPILWSLGSPENAAFITWHGFKQKFAADVNSAAKEKGWTKDDKIRRATKLAEKYYTDELSPGASTSPKNELESELYELLVVQLTEIYGLKKKDARELAESPSEAVTLMANAIAKKSERGDIETIRHALLTALNEQAMGAIRERTQRRNALANVAKSLLTTE